MRDPSLRAARARELVAGALLAALLTSIAVAVLTQVWDQQLDKPFQYSQYSGDDQQDATLEMMLIKNIHEAGWFNTNPKLNAPFEQRWAEWPMGGDLVAYTIKKGIVDATGDVPLTLNLFWLLTFPLVALVAYPSLRALRASKGTALIGAVLYALAPYHFRNSTGHSNLAFYAGIPVIVVACVRLLGPPDAFPTWRDLRHRAGWRRLRWLLLGAVFIGITGIYYLAFLLSMLAICALLAAIAHRRPDRLLMAVLIGGAGLVASIIANFPTLQYRLQYGSNILPVPERVRGASEKYPLRIAELLSPVTDHRFAPFSTLADSLSAPNRHGLGAANLGTIAAVGFVTGIVVLLAHVVPRRTRGGWTLEARLGLVMLVALLLGVGGGVSRLLESVGLQGVRAWSRIAIVIAFAALTVSMRLLDRARVSFRLRRGHRLPTGAWISVLVLVLLFGAWDQTAATVLPGVTARGAAWDRDARFVAALEARVPPGTMVFQLPVTDFPDHEQNELMSSHDLVKEGYLHSRTLHWSAGGIRGRSTEWQFPAEALHPLQFARGLAALGFGVLFLDTDGYRDHGAGQVADFTRILGPPIATQGGRLVTWSINRSRSRLLAGLDRAAVRRVAQHMLELPRLYLRTDVNAIDDRPTSTPACASAMLKIVNPARRAATGRLTVRIERDHAVPPSASVRIAGRDRRLHSDGVTELTVHVRPGTTEVPVRIRLPDVRCDDVSDSSLATVSASLTPQW